MRRLWFGLAIFAGLLASSSTSHAQLVGTAALDDPFLAYYGFYLPRQAAMAAQPGPELSINELSAARQVTAITERAGLYEPPAGLGAEGYDPRHPFANGSGVSRRPLSRTGVSNANVNGEGPKQYYSRATGYYPTLRAGRGPNSYVATVRSSRARGRGSPNPSGGMQTPRATGRSR